jgi:CHAT domain-containing protein
MVSRSMEQQQVAIAAGKDAKIAQMDQDSHELRVQIAERTRRSAGDPMLPALKLKLDEMERDVAGRLSSVGVNVTLRRATVAELLRVLDPQDAAVEIIRFPFSDRLGSTNRNVYCALIARAGSKPNITMVLLGDASAIEATHLFTLSSMNVRAAIPNRNVRSYGSSFWSSLEPAVRKARRIYLSPDGVLNQTPFLALENSDGKTYLIDTNYDVRPVSSTADLLLQNTTISGHDALLIGYPDFEYSRPGDTLLNSTGDASAANLFAAQAMWGNMSVGVGRLESTKTEVEAIQQVLVQQKWQVSEPYEQKRALKSVLLMARHPQIVHLATHGFFLQQGRPAMQDTRPLENFMSSAGLLLAGANRTLRGENASQVDDDGVLSAAEVVGLDLRGTELVVLSACDTGLGQEGTGGEIFGLRRAFQVAGADSILMSMWQVNDGETANFMRLFYQEWFRTGDKFVALRNAAKEERKTHPDPYYWAGFVLYSRQ